MAQRNLDRATLTAWTQGSGDDVVRPRILFLSGGKAEGNNISAFPLSQSFDQKWMAQIDYYNIR
jgi:hypothetical protein